MPRRPRLQARLALAILGLLALVTVAACAPPSGGSGSPADAVVGAINADRGAAGMGPVAVDLQLGMSAQAWADHLAATGTLVHRDMGTLIGQLGGFRALGENLLMAGSATSADSLEDMWMASPGHRANILGASYTDVGVGTAPDGRGRVFVVALFGARW